jgi:hypothetical protein
MVQLEYLKRNLLHYSAGLHLLPIYHLQYPGTVQPPIVSLFFCFIFVKGTVTPKMEMS